MVVVANASYLRTIRIASFDKNINAENFLKDAKESIKKYDNILELQKVWDFKFKVRKSGKYYVVLAEPFRDRKVLQEVLDTLRLRFNGLYVTKLDPSLLEEEKEMEKISIQSETIPIIEPVEIKQVEIAPVEIEEKESKIIIKEEVQKTQPEIEKLKPKKTNYTIWQLLFVITFLLLIIIFIFLLKIRRENEKYINQLMINDEKFKYLNQKMVQKEKFVSHASHELRTPMTSIIGLTQLVLEDNLSPVQKDYIQRIKSSSKNLLSIVNDILDFSKIQAGELKLEKIEFNINDVFEYVLNIISLQAKNNNIDIQINIDKDVPSHIIGDSLRLEQVLINLLGNSVKFTKNGKIFLSVKKQEMYGDSISLEFIVADTGIGMTDAQAKGIFQSYSQASESTSREFGGTGLGLSITKELVQMMNGKIKVESTKGVGTTFTFDIKFKIKDINNKRQYRLPSSNCLNKKVLLIDFSNEEVKQLVEKFAYFKYKTYLVSSFEELKLDDDILYDIIIVEESQLNKNTIAKIKKLQFKYKSKIVILSEFFSNNDKNIQNLAIDAYLKIPFTQQSVLNMITELYVLDDFSDISKKDRLKNRLKSYTGKKILVAEDNELNHKVIRGLFEQTGLDLTFAVDGEEALNLVRKDIDFSLILMDINMPKLNGYEVTKEIRKNQKYNKIPILALSADVGEEFIEKALSSGMQGHISKPITVEIFYQKIIDALNKKEIDKKRFNKTKNYITKEPSDNSEELLISIGLGRCNYDKDFYISILKDFKIMYLKSSSDIENLCKNQKFKEARHKAMDIKDIAINIGAYNLAEFAAAMEYEFEKGLRSNWQELINRYSINLDKLIKEIDKYLDTNG